MSLASIQFIRDPNTGRPAKGCIRDHNIDHSRFCVPHLADYRLTSVMSVFHLSLYVVLGFDRSSAFRGGLGDDAPPNIRRLCGRAVEELNTVYFELIASSFESCCMV